MPTQCNSVKQCKYSPVVEIQVPGVQGTGITWETITEEERQDITDRILSPVVASANSAHASASTAKEYSDKVTAFKDEIVTTANNINSVKTTAQNVDDIKAISDNLPEILQVSESNEQIITVVDNLADVKTNAANVSAIKGIGDNLTEVLKSSDYAAEAKYWADQANAIAVSEAVIATGTDEARTLADWTADIPSRKTSLLGLLPNDDFGTNTAILAAAINKGFRIIVDGVYKIKATAMQDLHADVYITGLSGSGFQIEEESAGNLFMLHSDVKRVKVYGVDFSCSASSFRSIFYYLKSDESDVVNLDVMDVRYNKFSGAISLCRSDGASPYENMNVRVRMSEVFICDNRMENILVSFASFGDVAIDNLELCRNVIHNFKYVIVNSGVTNPPSGDFADESDKITLSKKNVLIEDNITTCDDDWGLIGGSSDYANYYCIALIEGDSATIQRNHTEGLKSGNFPNVAVYDFYASVNDLAFRNNKYINNVNFNATDESTGAIFKAKGGTGHHDFVDNVVIIDEGYIDKICALHGFDKSVVKHYLSGSYSKHSVNISRNKIDAYKLWFYDNNNQNLDFTFNDNIIKAKYAYGYISSALHNISVYICSNFIEFEEGDVAFLYDVGQTLKSVCIVNNNLISGSNDRGSVLSTPKAGVVNISDNRVVAEHSGAYPNSYSTLSGHDNFIKSEMAVVARVNSWRDISFSSGTVVNTAAVTAGYYVNFPIIDSAPADHLMDIDIHHVSNDGTESDAKIKYTLYDNCSKLKFINSNGEEIIKDLTQISTNEWYSLSKGNVPITLALRTDGSAYLYSIEAVPPGTATYSTKRYDLE